MGKSSDELVWVYHAHQYAYLVSQGAHYSVVQYQSGEWEAVLNEDYELRKKYAIGYERDDD